MAFDPATGQLIPDPPQPTPQPTGTPAAPGGITINVPPSPPAPSAPAAGTLSPEMQAILDAERERVREEEKNKLYPQIEELKGTVKTLSDAEAERQAEIAAQQQAAAEAERLRQEAEMSALERVQQIEQQMNDRLRAAEEQAERERLLREHETRFSAVLQYRARRLAEEADNIIPQMADLVRGNTEEEIDASIEDMKTRTAAIAQDVQQAQFSSRQQIPMPVSGAPAVSQEALIGADNQRTLSIDDLRNMDASEYAKNRDQLLGATSAAVRERGLYGAP